jgi:hypothetical protein
LMLQLRIAMVTQALPASAEIELGEMRTRFQGSPLWIDILRAKYEDLSQGTDWAQRVRISEDFVASAKQMRSRLLEAYGLLHLGLSQMGIDSVQDGLHSMGNAHGIFRYFGMDYLAVDAMLLLAKWQRHLRNYRAAEQSLKLASEMTSLAKRESAMLDFSIQQAIVQLLLGLPTEAHTRLQALPLAQLNRARDGELVDWAEAVALVLKSRGQMVPALRLAKLFRSLDHGLTSIPALKRFHDEHFPATYPAVVPTAEEADVLRTELRRRIREFQTHPLGELEAVGVS